MYIHIFSKDWITAQRFYLRFQYSTLPLNTQKNFGFHTIFIISYQPFLLSEVSPVKLPCSVAHNLIILLFFHCLIFKVRFVFQKHQSHSVPLLPLLRNPASRFSSFSSRSCFAQPLPLPSFSTPYDSYPVLGAWLSYQTIFPLSSLFWKKFFIMNFRLRYLWLFDYWEYVIVFQQFV